MEIKPLKLEGTFEITFNRIDDERGYFMETYSQKAFAEHNLQINWIQENQSLSTRPHTLRGLHFQVPPFAQAKLVRVVSGEILDVFVDLRKDSPTCGEWDSVLLTEANHKAVYIERGFAHGFCTLTENVVVQYKIDNLYDRASERGLRWDDADIGIDWNIGQPFLSAKDADLPFYKDFISPF